jgi:hypothetical protein
MKILPAVLALMLAYSGSASAIQAGQSPQAKETSASPVDSAADLFAMANAARRGANLPPLRWDSALASAANSHCLIMAAEGSLFHRYPSEPDIAERARKTGASFSLIEENVAADSTTEGLNRQWTDTVDDRKWLNPEIDAIGIAVVPRNGMLLAAALYAHAVPEFTQDQAERTIAEILNKYGVAIAHNNEDARKVCAGRTSINIRPSLTMVWQSPDLAQLPEPLPTILPQAHFRKAAVGNCPAQSLNAAFKSYRVAVLFFREGVGVY